MKSKTLALTAVFAFLTSTVAQTGSRMNTKSTVPAARITQPPLGSEWPLEKSKPIIDKTQIIRLAPDLSQLSAGERTAVAKLLELGKIFQGIYEEQRHKQALSSYNQLLQRETRSPATENLLTLYRLNQGPIATTLENKREAFLPVEPVVPGKNMYPWGVTKEELESFLAEHPEKRDEILDQRSVARIVNLDNLRRDLTTLAKYPALATLHPDLGKRLEDTFQTQMRRQRAPRPVRRSVEYYAVPYSVAYANDLM